LSRDFLKTLPLPGLFFSVPRRADRRGERNTVFRAGALRPPLRDSQEDRPCWLCPVCAAEQYCRDRGRLWRGRRVCPACFSRLEKEEEET